MHDGYVRHVVDEEVRILRLGGKASSKGVKRQEGGQSREASWHKVP